MDVFTAYCGSRACVESAGEDDFDAFADVHVGGPSAGPIQHLSLAANKNGSLQAVRHDVRSTTAVSKVFIEAAAHRTSRFLYKSPNIQVSHQLVPLDVGPPTQMRAPGQAPGLFALESAMDELAAKLGMDPIELRIINNAEVYPGRNVPWSSKNLTQCYQVGAEKFGWSKRKATPGSLRDADWLLE